MKDPKEKAVELIARFSPYADRGLEDSDANEIESAKKCALICVEEILADSIDHFDIAYWTNVRHELISL